MKNPISRECHDEQVNLSEFEFQYLVHLAVLSSVVDQLHFKMMLEVLTLSTSQCDLTCTLRVFADLNLGVIKRQSQSQCRCSQWLSGSKNMPAMQKLQV